METGSTGKVTEEAPMYIEKLIENIKYPISKNDLIEKVRESRKGQSQFQEGGDPVLEEMLRHIAMLPDKQYKSAEDIRSELMKR